MRVNRSVIEVFTDGCPICQETVDQVKALLDCGHTLEVYDLRAGWNRTDWLSKASGYGVKRVPAIAVNGRLLDWVRHQPIPVTQLRSAGHAAVGLVPDLPFIEGPLAPTFDVRQVVPQ